MSNALTLTKPTEEIAGKLKCPHCTKTFLKATGLGSHLRVHGIAGKAKSTLNARASKTGKKLGRPVGSKSKAKAYCVPCKKTFKNAHGLSVHNSQMHISNNHSNRKGTPSHAINSQGSANEEINLAFLAGALCERLILSSGTELLAELVTGRLSAARLGNSQVR